MRTSSPTDVTSRNSQPLRMRQIRERRQVHHALRLADQHRREIHQQFVDDARLDHRSVQPEPRLDVHFVDVPAREFLHQREPGRPCRTSFGSVDHFGPDCARSAASRAGPTTAVATSTLPSPSNNRAPGSTSSRLSTSTRMG